MTCPKDCTGLQMPVPLDDSGDIMDYKFATFCDKNFAGNNSHTYIKEELSQPLLPIEDKEDEQAALVVWITILRFMGDHPAYRSDPKTRLEKLPLIIGNGLLRPGIRDEIYCQICKQLSQNPSKSSHARGWYLLALCVGCFAPSEKFVEYLRCFIKEGPPRYAPYCEERLSRTLKNGTRKQPPSWLELQAVKTKKPLRLSISFVDGKTNTLLADSAKTARELCQQLADKIGLKDQFGFYLYIAQFDMVSSLGSEGDHIFDAISQCEQYAKEQGTQEKDAPWTLFYEKGIFEPWHDPAEDSVATNLIYQQIVRCIKSGEYCCDKDEDLAMIAAQQYYIDNGADMDIEQLQSLVDSCIPDECISSIEAHSYWMQEIVNAFKKSCFVRERVSPLRVKEDIVNFAKHEWQLLFSRSYEVYKFTGPDLPKYDVTIAVNHTGITVVDDDEQVLLELLFPEIMAVGPIKIDEIHDRYITLSTIQGAEYTFTSPNAEDIRELVVNFLEGLKKRSKYAIAIQDYNSPYDDLKFIKGDLIILDEDFKKMGTRQGWCSGECARNQEMGEFPADHIYVLPTMTKPTPEIQAQLISIPSVLASIESKDGKSEAEDKPHTLQEYSKEHFRPQLKSRQVQPRHQVDLWSFSKEPLKQPLLNTLQGMDEMSRLACLCFNAILEYMGDHPSKSRTAGIALTDQVFESPLKHGILKDEIYCQLVKQLTDNSRWLSEERGWELMWLVTGCFTPSANLLREVTLFFTSCENKIAKDCLGRMQKTIRSGERKCPPHHKEVEAIQQKNTRIVQKVYFPDDTDQAFEVDSSTRAKDLCQNIATHLMLRSAEGFSLFFKTADKDVSVPEEDFFFDFVRHLTEQNKEAQNTKDDVPPQFMYQVFFKRKLWTHVVPGEDRVADTMFHYHQELSTLLLGYHKCTEEEAAQLAAYVYRIKNGEDQSKLEPAAQPFLRTLRSFPKELLSLLPRNLTKNKSARDWMKSILVAYNKNREKIADDCKISFLKNMYKWATFGSVFFDVKQMTENRFPEHLLVAINNHGVRLIHPRTKEILAIYTFIEICNWSSSDTYFHMTIGNLVKPTKHLFETSLGYKMSDLLKSYKMPKQRSHSTHYRQSGPTKNIQVPDESLIQEKGRIPQTTDSSTQTFLDIHLAGDEYLTEA